MGLGPPFSLQETVFGQTGGTHQATGYLGVGNNGLGSGPHTHGTYRLDDGLLIASAPADSGGE